MENELLWLSKRKEGIGGTDISALLGVNPWNTAIDVFLDKTTTDIDYDDNIAKRRGKLLESFVADLYKEETKHDIERNYDESLGRSIAYKHPLIDFMMATPDYFFYEFSSPDKQLLEIKTAVGRGAKKWYEGIPEYVLLQLQQQMFVMEKQYAVLATLIDDDFAYLTIQRNEDLIDRMVSVASDFWYGNVLKNKMPDPRTIEDYRVYYKQAKAGSIIPASSEILNTISELKAMKELEKKQKVIHDQTKNNITRLDLDVRAYIKDYETLMIEDVVVATYKVNAKGSRTLLLKDYESKIKE